MAKAKAKPAAKAAPKPAKPKKSGPGFDYKQLLLSHGERIGLGSAGVLALLLIIFFFLLPWASSGSPTEKASALNSKSDKVERDLRNPDNKPGPADKPPEDIKDKLVLLTKDTIDTDPYRIAGLIPTDETVIGGRRQPKVLNVEEVRAAVARVQLKTYMFTRDDPPKVYVLEGDASSGTEMKSPMTTPKTGGPGFAGGKGKGPGLSTIFGKDKGKDKAKDKSKKGPQIDLFGGVKQGLADDGKKDKVLKTVSIEQSASKTLATQIYPRRVAVIAASFPYKKQVEEFKSRLNMRSTDEVISEASAALDKNNQAQFAFRFLGVIVERREVDDDGKPGDWRTLDLNADYRPLLVATDSKFETDDPTLEPLKFTGLVMPRLKLFRTEEGAGGEGMGMGMVGPMMGKGGPPPRIGTGGPGMGMGDGMGGASPVDELADQYPPLELELEGIKKTLDSFKDKTAAEQAALLAKRFKVDGDYDVFAPRQVPGGAGSEAMAPGMMTPIPGGRPSYGTKGEMGMGMGMGMGMNGTPQELPEFCLVRVVDVNVEPGKTYEYRLKIRMANPNESRRDVASPGYAVPKFLESAEWTKQQIKVRVEEELVYYAIDQEQVEKLEDPKTRYTGPYAGRNVPAWWAKGNSKLLPDREIFLQAHRWLEAVQPRGDALAIGEWSVAERIPVCRGEYIGRKERVEVPYWRIQREEFALATDARTSQKLPGILVPFGYDKPNRPEAILVDFTPTDVYYQRSSRGDEKTEAKPIRDYSAGEVLIMTPEGKLILKETARDIADAARIERLEKVRKRLKDVKEIAKPSDQKKGPFDMGS